MMPSVSQLIIAAEVPAAHVTRIAKAVLDQFGREKVDAVTLRLGRAGERHGADAAHRTLCAAGLKADVPIKHMSEPCKGLPVCYMSDYVAALKKRNQLNRLCAGLRDKEMQQANSAFWRKIRILFPSLEVFKCFDDPEHPAQPDTTFACDIHTDEGRGQKKVPMMVISSAPCLGLGTLKQRATRSLPDKLALNFAGQTQGNRMVHAVVPKDYYDGDQAKYQAMCGHIAMNCRLLLDQGFEYQGRVWCVAYVATLGDWPAHIKNGNFLRSFLNGVKQANQTEDRLGGICHLCCAGISGVPWEDVSLSAKSLLTIGLVEAWTEDSAFLSLITYEGLRHACFPPDIWHGWALGWGKETSASSVVATLKYYAAADRVEDRVSAADANLHAYLATTKDNLSFKVLNKGKLGWETQDSFPKGSWSKAEDTRIILQWQINWLQANRETWHGDELLSIVLPAFKAIDFAFSELYSHGYFIPADAGIVIAKSGLSFLNMMQACIKLCVDACVRCEQGPLNLFKQQPKMHMMFHAFAQMYFQCQKHGFCQNPLSQSCQMPEDLIGKVCRTSRRVDNRLVSQRTLDCYLICAGMQWLIPYVYEDWDSALLGV